MTNALVVDASVVVSLLLANDQPATRLRSALSGRTIYAPELLDIEVMSVLRRLTRSRELTYEQAQAALAALIEFPAIRVTHRPLLAHAWAVRDNISAYDASYVALATRLPATLVTADARLAQAVASLVKVEFV